MKFVWTVVLLLSIVLAVCVPLFFGHGLAAHEPKWFGVAAGCLVAAALLFLVQRRASTEPGHLHHH